MVLCYTVDMDEGIKEILEAFNGTIQGGDRWQIGIDWIREAKKSFGADQRLPPREQATRPLFEIKIEPTKGEITMCERLKRTIEAIEEIAKIWKLSGLPMETAGTTINTFIMGMNGKREEPKQEYKQEPKDELNMTGCDHKNTKPVSGKRKDGSTWEGLECLDCKIKNFHNTARDGGKYWTGWEAKK